MNEHKQLAQVILLFCYFWT